MRRRKFITFIGGAVAWPLAARAQPAVSVLGYLSTGSPESDVMRVTGFRQGLNETGSVEGRDVTIEYRWTDGKYDQLPALAADLVRRQVAVIVATGTPPALAAKAATSTIPIVFNAGDPIQAGLVASLSRPGGNATGVSTLNATLTAKRLELLHELLPTGAAIALLVNQTNSYSEAEAAEALAAARSRGLQLHVLRASNASEVDVAFKSLAELRAAGLIVGLDSFLANQSTQIVSLATHFAVPTVSGYREFAAAGGLMSYATDLREAYRQVGIYAGKILKGANPAELPVQQIVRVELVVNLRTAKAMGLDVPLRFLAFADEVIE